MRDILKMTGSLLIIALLIAHFFLLGLFLAPTDKLMSLIRDDDQRFFYAEDLPTDVEAFLLTNKVSVDGDYRFDSTTKGRLVLGILQMRREHFMQTGEQIALDANLLNYGDDIFGIQEASEYFYHKPLESVSDKEWITLVNLQKILKK